MFFKFVSKLWRKSNNYGQNEYILYSFGVELQFISGFVIVY